MNEKIKVWVNLPTTTLTVDGKSFIVKTDAIKQYGKDKIIEHIRKWDL